MQISDRRCEAFRELCRVRRGMDITSDQARDILTRLLVLFDRYSRWHARAKASGKIVSW